MQGKRPALPPPMKQLPPPAIKLGPPPDVKKAGELIDEALESGEAIDLMALQQAVQSPNPVQAIIKGLHNSEQANGAVKQLDKMNPQFLRPGSKPTDRAAAFDALPPDAEITVFHATDEKSAAAFLGEGITAAKKPARQAAEGFGPGQGLDAGVYVGTDPVSVSGYGKNIIEIKVKKSDITVPTEGAKLNPNRTPGQALVDGDAVIKSDIPQTAINKVTGEKNRTALEAATPKVLKLTPADTLDMKKAMEKETDPYTLFSMAMEQTTPRDIRQVAANRLNDLKKNDVFDFLRNEADQDFLERVGRSGMFDSTTKQFAKDVKANMVRGGLDSASNVDAMSRARMAFAEGQSKYEANRINMKELQAEAEKSKATINTVLNLKVGEPKTPLEVAQISKPVRDMGEAFIKNIDEAEAGLARGDYSKFWESMADFNLLVEAHWPYMSPRQVAGQTLKTYDEPVLSATRFLQQIPGFSSWLGKLKLNTVEEVEAAAPLILREMQKVRAPGEISQFAKRIAEETAEKGEEVLKDPTWRDKASFYFINSLMSGTDTIGRNIAGNTLAVPWHYLEKQTSVAASKVINPFLTAEHKLDAGNFSDANAAMGIWFRTMWDATRYTLTRNFDARKGLIPNESVMGELMGNRFDLAKYSTTGTTNPIGGIAGQIIGTPVSISQMADEVSRMSAYKMAVGERLRQDWVGTGSKMPWRQYVDEGFENTPPSMHEYGIRMANELTFSDPMSKLGSAVMGFRRGLPGMEFLLPFVKTVDRLTAYQFNRTPGLNLLSKRLLDELRSDDQVIKAEAIGRLTLSAVMGAGLFAAARTNAPDGLPLITGGGPTDRGLMMKLRDADVLKPYTIWTPAGRVNYGYLAPMRGPLGMIADTSEIFDEIRNPTEASSIWDGIILAGTRNFFDMTYTKQFADMMDIWDKPSGSSGALARMGANLVKGFVEPSIVRQIYRTLDPATRETHGFLDLMKKDIYGWGLPARTNPLTGEPVMNPPRMLADVPGLNWFLPTSPVQPATDDFANAVRELGYRPPEFPKSFAGARPSESPFAYSGQLGEAREAQSGIPLPPELQEKGKKYAFGGEGFGRTLNDEAQALVRDPGFLQLQPIDRKEAFDALYHARYGAAVDRLKAEHPELLEAYEVKMFQRGQIHLPPEDREAFEATETAQPDIEPEVTSLLPQEEAAP
jgi:hypothetical protein